MKKHILGAAIFGFIFASFAVAFAVFYSPQLPQIPEVKQDSITGNPVISYGKTSCFRNNRKNISVEVVNSQYFFDEDKIYSEIKLAWNGSGAPPKKIYLTTLASVTENKVNNSFGGVVQILENPFKDATEKTFKVVSRSSDNKKIKAQDNLYVIATASEDSNGEISESSKSFSEKKEVVFVHGESSVLRK